MPPARRFRMRLVEESFAHKAVTVQRRALKAVLALPLKRCQLRRRLFINANDPSIFVSSRESKADASLANAWYRVRRKWKVAIHFIGIFTCTFCWTLSSRCRTRYADLGILLSFFFLFLSSVILIPSIFDNLKYLCGNPFSCSYLTEKDASCVHTKDNNYDVIKTKCHFVFPAELTFSFDQRAKNRRDSSAFQLPEPIPLWIRCARKSRGETRNEAFVRQQRWPTPGNPGSVAIRLLRYSSRCVLGIR